MQKRRERFTTVLVVWYGCEVVRKYGDSANTDVDGPHGIIALKRPIFVYLWSWYVVIREFNSSL